LATLPLDCIDHPDNAARPVRKRCVFYLSGFDPKGAAHYHALYRSEAAAQAQVSGLQVTCGRRQKTTDGNAFWDVSASPPEGTVKTRYEFLRWDDIVRQHWPRSQARLVKDLVRTTWLNLRTGALWRMFRLAWPPVLAIFLPFVLLCAIVVGAPLLAAAAIWATPGSWSALAAGLAALTTLAGWLLLALQLEKKFNMAWLLRSYAFTALQAKGLAPELDARLEEHAETLLERIRSGGYDEVLVVGHSSGSMMAATALANALRRDPELGNYSTVVSLLTLGQCMPLLSSLPMARRFRGDLQCLAKAKNIDWIDFSAPPDGCCFALVNPVLACGESVNAVKDRPKLLSPRFADMFDADDYAAMRRDRFRCHFQYLMASKKLVSFDYFAITAGAHTLAHRFRGDASVTDYQDLRFF
jgi:pimeloyl-ACP methyl ester carboxylesterase